jgi:hypothetical protein
MGDNQTGVHWEGALEWNQAEGAILGEVLCSFATRSSQASKIFIKCFDYGKAESGRG